MTYIPPNPNGQATMADSGPVVIASDQSVIPINKLGVTGVAQTSTAATANFRSTIIDTLNYSEISFHIQPRSLDVATATCQMFVSNNGTDFIPMPDLIITLAAGDSENALAFIGIPFRYACVDYTKNTVAAGTLGILYTIK
jgi:hypothetical protein